MGISKFRRVVRKQEGTVPTNLDKAEKNSDSGKTVKPPPSASGRSAPITAGEKKQDG